MEWFAPRDAPISVPLCKGAYCFCIPVLCDACFCWFVVLVFAVSVLDYSNGVSFLDKAFVTASLQVSLT